MAEEFDKLSPDQEAPADAPVQAQPSRRDAGQTEEAPRRPGADLFEWLQMIMGCMLAAVVLFNCFARLTRVDGSSMDNTLKDGELMWVWSLGYHPEQGDIVVLNKKTAHFLGNRAIVKRVIAVGGQTVDINYAAGAVYVDGVPLDEPYIKETMYYSGNPFMQQTHWEVPEGSVFVMGDNRNNSTDSRDNRLGPVDEDYILGKVVFALWPPAKFGPL